MRWRILALAAVTATFAGAAAAQSHWRGGVQFGWGPAYPPYYQPHYHQPPPPPVASEGCYAGAYVCPLGGPAYVGAPCGCPTGQGTAWGRAR